MSSTTAGGSTQEATPRSQDPEPVIDMDERLNPLLKNEKAVLEAKQAPQGGFFDSKAFKEANLEVSLAK